MTCPPVGPNIELGTAMAITTESASQVTMDQDLEIAAISVFDPDCGVAPAVSSVRAIYNGRYIYDGILFYGA